MKTLKLKRGYFWDDVIEELKGEPVDKLVAWFEYVAKVALIHEFDKDRLRENIVDLLQYQEVTFIPDDLTLRLLNNLVEEITRTGDAPEILFGEPTDKDDMVTCTSIQSAIRETLTEILPLVLVHCDYGFYSRPIPERQTMALEAAIDMLGRLKVLKANKCG